MPQLFRPGANSIARLVLWAVPTVASSAVVLGAIAVRSPYTTGEGRFVEQTVPFSHKHHAGELGIDCRMCHYGVETGARAIVPPTKVCMTCHSQLWTNAALLAPVRASMASGRPLRWARVVRLPDYVYFDHHVHVRGGVPCAACHGAVDDMPLMRQATPMTMAWCLDCHRDPAGRIVPASREFDPRPYRGGARAPIRAFDRRKMTDCSTCHR